MSNELNAKLDASGLRFAIVVSRFNDFITSRLLAGARDALLRHNAADQDITEVRVPGAWELPLAATALAESGRYDALICLGCVLRGQTSHHAYIGGAAARGLAAVSRERGVPIGFGVLTPDTLEQAIERAGGKAGNKGADAALSAIEMANLLRNISDAAGGGGS
ncbi:MAG: 6,7-dimethyl-8-ribityllumazine synthase [Phycisphaerae bacterium]